MKLLLENVNAKHLERLHEIAKALNFTIKEIESQYDSANLVEDSETEYLLSSKANQEYIEHSLKQAAEGRTTSVDIDNLWK